MQYTLKYTSGTFAHFKSMDITNWTDPRATKGQLVYDIKSGNTFQML